MKRILFFLLFIFVLGPFQAVAQQWNLDTVHTNFYFDVKHTYATVRGQFLDFTGDVFFDPGNLDKSNWKIGARAADGKQKLLQTRQW